MKTTFSIALAFLAATAVSAKERQLRGAAFGGEPLVQEDVPMWNSTNDETVEIDGMGNGWTPIFKSDGGSPWLIDSAEGIGQYLMTIYSYKEPVLGRNYYRIDLNTFVTPKGYSMSCLPGPLGRCGPHNYFVRLSAELLAGTHEDSMPKNANRGHTVTEKIGISAGAGDISIDSSIQRTYTVHDVSVKHTGLPNHVWWDVDQFKSCELENWSNIFDDCKHAPPITSNTFSFSGSFSAQASMIVYTNESEELQVTNRGWGIRFAERRNTSPVPTILDDEFMYEGDYHQLPQTQHMKVTCGPTRCDMTNI